MKDPSTTAHRCTKCCSTLLDRNDSCCNQKSVYTCHNRLTPHNLTPTSLSLAQRVNWSIDPYRGSVPPSPSWCVWVKVTVSPARSCHCLAFLFVAVFAWHAMNNPPPPILDCSFWHYSTPCPLTPESSLRQARSVKRGGPCHIRSVRTDCWRARLGSLFRRTIRAQSRQERQKQWKNSCKERLLASLHIVFTAGYCWNMFVFYYHLCITHFYRLYLDYYWILCCLSLNLLMLLCWRDFVGWI